MAAKVLIVDDSEEVRTELREMLCREGYVVVEADDGRKAMEICKNQKDFDLILTDQNMPVLNGLDMLRELRQFEDFRSTYVVFHTTESKKLLQAKGRDLGINGWVVKPVEPENLKLLIQHVLQTKKA